MLAGRLVVSYTMALDATSPPAAATSRSIPSGIPVGEPIPQNVDHAVSVSLPLWQDVVDYEEGRLGDVLKTGYPRFFIHRSIQKLANVMECKFARPGEVAMLFPTPQHASQCRDFVRARELRRAADASEPVTTVPIRIVRFCVMAQSASDGATASSVQTEAASDANTPMLLYLVLYPERLFPLAKNFWQHTGTGISSRLADECLRIIAHNDSLMGDCGKPAQAAVARHGSTTSVPGVSARGGGFGRSRYQSRVMDTAPAETAPAPKVLGSVDRAIVDTEDEALTLEHSVYVEERYGRNLPFAHASRAKLALRRRIAGTLLGEVMPDDHAADATASARDAAGLCDDDVYLFSCGMASIFHAHQTLMLERALAPDNHALTTDEVTTALRTMQDPSFVQDTARIGKSICFGFPYTDTLKLLQKWGPGCEFFGNGTDADLDRLEELLRSPPPGSLPIVALFCEFPSNPLLRTPDLPRIRRLADEFGFSVVVDETIGNFVNVEVMPYSDLVVSSLTKVFSGNCNVMGGSLVLNPQSARAKNLRTILTVNYQDAQWPEDSIFLERNSRDFVERIAQIDRSAESVADALYAQITSPQKRTVLADVYYPKYTTLKHYEACRRKQPYGDSKHTTGYGGLFSVELTTTEAARAFYDRLACAKGPSLGTNCTLACPYTLLAHYGEMDWTESVGVSRNLVRVSVGLEGTETLLRDFQDALDAAEAA